MARSPLTLAALATAAVPGLTVTATRALSGTGHGEFDSALLTAEHGGPLVVRVPESPTAETDQASDALALRALSAGIRGRLPFDVPGYLGQTPAAGTRAVVTDYLPGRHVAPDEVAAGTGLAASIGRALAAVHLLPTAFVGDAGLPVLTAPESRSAVVSLVERAVATGHVPTALRDRWRHATESEDAWQFRPAVVNGSMTIDSVLVDGESVGGVLGWSGLRVGDPALDIHWLLALREDAMDAALAAYHEALQSVPDRHLLQRAMLYSELEVARWMLHGRQVHDQAIVDDAVRMMDGLVDRVHQDRIEPLDVATGPIMAITDVELMLQTTPGSAGAQRSSGLPPVEDSAEESRLELDDEAD